MKHFYKIVNSKAQVGSGTIKPAGFTIYTVGQEPQKLIDALAFRTPEEIVSAKWNELNEFLSNLTVQRPETETDPIGFKFSADPQSISNISLEIDTMLDTDTRTWYEDWGSAIVTKQELQEAKRLASEAKQEKLTELFGS